MKLTYKLLILFLVVLAGCGKPSDQNSEEMGNEDANQDPNQALYDQVMNLHDEVMPKMEDIYKIKSQLQEKIANSPDLVKERKEALERMILTLDSANNSMMEWMHQFNPLPDSVDAEQSRAYLESQMEKIKGVKEIMLSTLEEAKAEVEKN
jgi:regulator of replication initiation timing